MAALTLTEYQDLIESVITKLKTEIVEKVSEDARVETRYITTQTNNNDEWIYVLREEDKSIDIWMITFDFLRGVNPAEQASSNSVKKPLKFVIDYVTDYKQGYDDSDNNTELPFRRKAIGVDYYLEKGRSGVITGLCNIDIIEWRASLGIKRFPSSAVHIAKFDISLELRGIHIGSI
jgi:hypothetical protein